MKDKTEEMSELYTMDHLNAEYSLIWKAQREAGVLWKDIPSFTEWVLGRLQRAESIVSSLPPSGAATRKRSSDALIGPTYFEASPEPKCSCGTPTWRSDCNLCSVCSGELPSGAASEPASTIIINGNELIGRALPLIDILIHEGSGTTKLLAEDLRKDILKYAKSGGIE